MRHLEIRSNRISDAKRFVEILSSPDFIFLPMPELTIESEKEFLRKSKEMRKEGSAYNFSVTYKDELVGAVGIKIDRHRDYIGEIGYFVDRKYWGKGFATAAVALVEQWAFKEIQIHRIELITHKKNIASQRVAAKCGYRKEGIQRGKLKIKDKFEDAYLFAKIKKIGNKESKMKVKQTEGRVWIDGIEGFNTDMYASSPHGCQARIMQAAGEKLDYDDMICYSAFAFRVGISEVLCPSAGNPFCGFECIEGSFRAFPWKVRLFEHTPWDKPKDDQAAFEADACAAIKQSIDRGIPVHYGGEEDGLIIGYADEGRRWWCVHPYHKNGSECFWHDEVKGMAGGNWPWGIVVWNEPKPSGECISISI